MTEGRYAGRHVWITGAGTGIGRATAVRFAREGAAVTLTARDAGRLEETAAMAREEGSGEVGVHPADITDAAALCALAKDAAAARGPFHAVIANAGIGGPNEPAPDGGDAGDRFGELVATNLLGTYHTLRAAVPHLEPQGGADPEATGEAPSGAGETRRHLVVVSSILARIGVPAYTGYCASKAGLLGLVRALAMELAPSQVQVNAVCPGWVDTQMARDGLEGMAAAMGTSFDEAHAIAMQAVPLGRMAKPEEIAGMIAWLCSADALGVTGQALDMNNGAFMS